MFTAIHLISANLGGLLHLSNEYGWPAQQVDSYEIVLANSTIVMASATEHADLYFALKVRLNNFSWLDT